MKHYIFLCAIGISVTASAGYAQEHGPVGLTMGYPGNVAVIWHVSDRIAIRPGVSFSHSTIDSETSIALAGIALTTKTSSTAWRIDGRVTGLFYLKRWENVRAYVAPSYAYGRQQTTTSTSSPITGGVVLPPILGVAPGLNRVEMPRKITTPSHSVGGAFGAQYTPHQRFGMYGEVGFSYSHVRAPTLSTSSDTVGFSAGTRSTAFGTTTGAGIIFYF
ncbi:MAG TPA: hypothetical protein VEK56_17880 [Vicinamibacterales bacterium]|nr:hypothetical protein [Vicinamibacterales bacterium]